MAMQPTPPLAPVTRMGQGRVLAVDQQPMHGQRGGKAGGAEDHRLAWIEPLGTGASQSPGTHRVSA